MENQIIPQLNVGDTTVDEFHFLLFPVFIHAVKKWSKNPCVVLLNLTSCNKISKNR